MRGMSFSAFFLCVFIIGCNTPHIEMLNAGNGEYFILQPDQNVKGDWPLVGYALRSSKDNRVICTFQNRPVELRFEDHNGDGVKDLIYIRHDQNVKGDWPLVGYSMWVAIRNCNGTFQPARMITTFPTLN